MEKLKLKSEKLKLKYQIQTAKTKENSKLETQTCLDFVVEVFFEVGRFGF
jgi:hypothetical protein